jgi:hypothetical protein
MNDREQERLDWAAVVGRSPEAIRSLLEAYPGYRCYRLGKAHVWCQTYEYGGTYGMPELYVDVLQGRDSIFPGILVKHVNVTQLTVCDCGNWLPPTKLQAELAEAKYKQTVMRAKRVLN